MVLQAIIIAQPYSGEFKERVYDNESSWNSQNWTFIKFINDDYSEWCGQFRGSPRQAAISPVNNNILILTLDYLYQLDKETGNLIEIEDQPQYQNVVAAPDGSFILADYYNLFKLTSSIKHKNEMQSPIEMDNIKFTIWNEEKLEFTCDEFTNWDRHLTMIYDCKTDKIEIKNSMQVA